MIFLPPPKIGPRHCGMQAYPEDMQQELVGRFGLLPGSHRLRILAKPFDIRKVNASVDSHRQGDSILQSR